MITITVTIEEEGGRLKTMLVPEYKNPTKCEFGMSQMVEAEFKKLQKRLAKKTGGQYIGG
jgi:hypothetical protein